MPRFKQRRDKLRRLVKKTGAEAILITNFTNVTYLTGFTGDDSYLLVTAKNEILLSDFRYLEQLQEQCPGLNLEIRHSSVSILEAVAKTVKKAKISSLAVEAGSMTLSLSQQISAKMEKVELVSTTGLVEQLREIKDKGEVDEIREAVDFAQRAFNVVRASLRPEQTELEIAYAIEQQIRLFGGTGCSFPPIVAVGAWASLPHAYPRENRICESDFVLIDWGAKGRLYMSDLTRVLATGKISPKLERIYGVVLKAQKQAIAKIKPGATMHQVDAAARNIIAKAGHDKHFGHGLGHGIGLEIHENPRLGVNQHRPLKAGMVVTVEPGIYLPAWGGVRIEDDILVTKTGHEVLSNVPKELADCIVA